MTYNRTHTPTTTRIDVFEIKAGSYRVNGKYAIHSSRKRKEGILSLTDRFACPCVIRVMLRTYAQQVVLCLRGETEHSWRVSRAQTNAVLGFHLREKAPKIGINSVSSIGGDAHMFPRSFSNECQAIV